MNVSRRAFLTGTTLATAGLAGCRVPLLSDRQQIDLELANYAPDPQEVSVSLLRPDEREFSEAEVFSRNYQVPPPEADESAGTTRAENVAPRAQYLVRVTPKFGVDDLYQYHYFPGENATDPEDSHVLLRIYPHCYFRDCPTTDRVNVRF